MNTRFSELIKNLEPLFKQLLNMPPVQAGSLPNTIPIRGIYLFSENGHHLYVGRSNNIKRRIGRHSRSGATYRMAAFAFHLARQATGLLKASYKKEGSRKELMSIPDFSNAFCIAKERIRKMENHT